MKMHLDEAVMFARNPALVPLRRSRMRPMEPDDRHGAPCVHVVHEARGESAHLEASMCVTYSGLYVALRARLNWLHFCTCKFLNRSVQRSPPEASC